MIKVTFFSNYLNHHQLPLCLKLNELTNGSFKFVAQKAISEKRIAFGYKNISNNYDFVVKTYESYELKKEAYKLSNESDYVLFGSSDNNYIKQRIKDNKITFKYSERLFRKNLIGLDYLKAFRRVYINHGKYKNKKLYMLCNGAYAAYDFNRFGAYINKTYKWGYFPETIAYDIDQLMGSKDGSILWVGRFMELKHPELMIELGKRLKKDNKDFVINLIGNGELENNLKELIKRNKLQNNIHMLGAMHPEEVRKYMEKASIFLFTSNKQEGWGAVLNEAMNSGCACVSSHAIGSSGYLIKHNENGYIYKDSDFEDLYNKTLELINNKNKRESFGKNAYKTISETWNANVAAQRFIKLAQCIKNGKDTPYQDGPCSRAYPIKEADMYNYLVKGTNEQQLKQ